MQLCAPQTPYGLAWNCTWASALEDRCITAWRIALPWSYRQWRFPFSEMGARRTVWSELNVPQARLLKERRCPARHFIEVVIHRLMIRCLVCWMLNEVHAKREISDTTVNTKLREELLFHFPKKLNLGIPALQAQTKFPYGHKLLVLRLHSMKNFLNYDGPLRL